MPHIHSAVHETDIYKFPIEIGPAETGDQITIGDLDGNIMVLIHYLIKFGIMSDVSLSDYQRLCEIYTKSNNEVSVDEIKEFNNILTKASYRDDVLIRLIGDETADRGENDYWIYKLLEITKERKVLLETLISNHGMESVLAFESKSGELKPTIITEIEEQTRSLQGLQNLKAKKFVSRKRCTELFTNYSTYLKALSYSISERDNCITIYSHAAIGINTIEELAQTLKVTYRDSSITELAQTIDEINAEFSEHVKKQTVNTLYFKESTIETKKYLKRDLTSAFDKLLWNKDYSPEAITRPLSHNGFIISYAHGHDSKDLSEPGVLNLNSEHEGNIRYPFLHTKIEVTNILEGQLFTTARPAEASESVEVSKSSEHLDRTQTTERARKVEPREIEAGILMISSADALRPHTDGEIDLIAAKKETALENTNDTFKQNPKPNYFFLLKCLAGAALSASLITLSVILSPPLFIFAPLLALGAGVLTATTYSFFQKNKQPRAETPLDNMPSSTP